MSLPFGPKDRLGRERSRDRGEDLVLANLRQELVLHPFRLALVLRKLRDVVPERFLLRVTLRVLVLHVHLALVLAEAGINVDCLPLLDLPQPGAHDIIGDRALGGEPLRVAALGRAVLDGLEAGGCVGVVKHIPGHGRAPADSHRELPVVEASADELEVDLAPFRALRDAPIAMVAHLLYPAWDDQRPASISPTIIAELIREEIGFDGLLISDDLAMGALTGTAGERAAAAVAAGCDLALYCSGDLADNEAVAAALGDAGSATRERLERAMARTGRGSGDRAALIGKRDALLALC